MNIEDWQGSDISDEVFDQATHWLVVLDDLDEQHDEESVALKRAFFEWLEADSAHSSAFAQMSDLWAKSACLQGMEHLLEDSKIIQFPLHGQSADALNKDDMTDTPIFNDRYASLSAPTWAYYLVIGLIGLSALFVTVM